MQVVNIQSQYNRNGTLNAIPIIIYHQTGDQEIDFSTNLDLLNKEMKYLHDNNFTDLTMADLAYNNKGTFIYIK